MKRVLKELLNKTVCIKTKSEEEIIGSIVKLTDTVVFLKKPLKFAAIPQNNGQMAIVFLNLDLSPASPNNVTVDEVALAIDSIEYVFEVATTNQLYSYYQSTVTGISLPQQNDKKFLEVVKTLNKQQGGGNNVQ